MVGYYSTKTYGHERGLSCAFRQWRATHSHCSLLHGYALSFRFVFGAQTLDDKNWVADFGDLGWLKSWLEHWFDHTTLIAADDPQLAVFQDLHTKHLIDLRVMESGVGCERTAEFVYMYVQQEINKISKTRVWLESVEVSEHSGNSAIFKGGKPIQLIDRPIGPAIPNKPIEDPKPDPSTKQKWEDFLDEIKRAAEEAERQKQGRFPWDRNPLEPRPDVIPNHPWRNPPYRPPYDPSNPGRGPRVFD